MGLISSRSPHLRPPPCAVDLTAARYYPGEPAGFGPGGAAAAEAQPGARVAAAAAGHVARDARPYPYVETLPATKLTPEALEYSKQRGIYRGEELSW